MKTIKDYKTLDELVAALTTGTNNNSKDTLKTLRTRITSGVSIDDSLGAILTALDMISESSPADSEWADPLYIALSVWASRSDNGTQDYIPAWTLRTMNPADALADIAFDFTSGNFPATSPAVTMLRTWIYDEICVIVWRLVEAEIARKALLVGDVLDLDEAVSLLLHGLDNHDDTDNVIAVREAYGVSITDSIMVVRNILRLVAKKVPECEDWAEDLRYRLAEWEKTLPESTYFTPKGKGKNLHYIPDPLLVEISLRLHDGYLGTSEDPTPEAHLLRCWCVRELNMLPARIAKEKATGKKTETKADTITDPAYGPFSQEEVKEILEEEWRMRQMCEAEEEAVKKKAEYLMGDNDLCRTWLSTPEGRWEYDQYCEMMGYCGF